MYIIFLKQLGEGINGSEFRGCTSLETFTYGSTEGTVIIGGRAFLFSDGIFGRGIDLFCKQLRTIVMEYIVEYYNNRYTGTAKLTITGIGNYTGTMSKVFTIKKPSVAALKSASVRLAVEAVLLMKSVLSQDCRSR